MSRLRLLGETSDRAETRSQEESDAAVGSPESRKRAASALIETHDRVFRRTARRYSICADDAEDAYQRALEILLTKAPPIEGDSLVRWMQTVTKREALAVRRLRERLLGSPRIPGVEDVDERDPLDSIASDRPEPEDRAGSRERVTRSREALRALKPQELRALTLKAEGYSYAEIGEITGWTYTKINRCMAEGRKRFLQAFADIEQGRRCEELAAALSQLADGESPKGSTEALEFHLRGCAGCRATLRAYRTVPQRVLELMPIVPAVDQSIGGRPHEWIAHHAGAALDKVREASYSLLVRGGGAGDAAPLASAGGTRGAGMAVVAKALALCGATAAGGAACVASGVVEPGALGVGSGGERAAIERPADAAAGAEGSLDPTANVVPDETALTTPDPVEPAASDDQQEVAAETPVQEQSQQFNIEAAPSGSGSSAGGNEFAGPSGGGGGSGGGGSGAQGFGIE